MHCEQTTKQTVGGVEECQNQSSAQGDGEKLQPVVESYRLHFPLQSFHQDPKLLSSPQLFEDSTAAWHVAHSSFAPEAL